MWKWKPSAISAMPTTAPVNADSRMINGSICQPIHAPTAPNSLKTRSSSSMKLPNTHTMMSAAAVMTRAVWLRPSATALLLSPVRSYSSLMRERRNTS